MNDGLLLLLQQGDDAALAPNGAIEAVSGPGEEASNGVMLLSRRAGGGNLFELIPIETVAVFDNAARKGIYLR